MIHYFLELACRDQDRQAPFERISADPSEFIDAEYMPTDISITDPRSMKLETLLKFFKHIAEREASHGIPHAFRFKNVLSRRKKGSLHAARYREDDEGSQEDNDRLVPVRRKRRKPKQRDGDITPESLAATQIKDSAQNARSLAPALTIPISEPSAPTTTGLISPEETPAPERRSRRTSTKTKKPIQKKGKAKKKVVCKK